MFQIELLYGVVFGFLVFVVIALLLKSFNEPNARKSIKIPVRTSNKERDSRPWEEEAVATPDFQWIIIVALFVLASLIMLQIS